MDDPRAKIPLEALEATLRATLGKIARLEYQAEEKSRAAAEAKAAYEELRAYVQQRKRGSEA